MEDETARLKTAADLIRDERRKYNNLFCKYYP